MSTTWRDVLLNLFIGHPLALVLVPLSVSALMWLLQRHAPWGVMP